MSHKFLEGFDGIMDEYEADLSSSQENMDRLFGKDFSIISDITTSAEFHDEVILVAEEKEKATMDALRELEGLILPILLTLIKPESVDKKYIYWPNRKDVIQSQIEKILAITRQAKTRNSSRGRDEKGKENQP